MPKSRVRKKKKKSTNKLNNEKKGVHIINKGNYLVLKNNKTAQQHAAFVEKVRQNRPLLLNTIQNSIDQIVSIFESYNKVQLLGGLTYNQFIKERFNASEDGQSEVTLEYAMSFATAIKQQSAVQPTSDVLNQLIDLLTSVRRQYDLYVGSEVVEGKNSEIESSIRYKTILEALYVRGNGYLEHIHSVYKELFKGHDEFLVNHYDFNSEQVLDTFTQLEESFACRVVYPNGIPHPANHSRFVEWSNGVDKRRIDKHFIDVFGEDNPDIIVEDSKVCGYRIDDVSQYYELFKIRYRYEYQKNVIVELSQEFGNNADFLNPKYKGLPLNETTITTNPFIKIGEDYYHFAFALPHRNLFYVVENLIKKADETYYNEKFLGNSHTLSRDNFLEKKAMELFQNIIPNSSVYINCKYITQDEKEKDYETELDLLVISPNATYLVEMKAGGLSAPSKRGALKSLKGQLKNSVGYGAYQNYRALEFIKNNSSPEFIDDQGNKIPINKTSKFFRITITLEHLADLVASMYDLKELGVIEKNIDFAWTCSIFDLIIFSEIIENETDFIDYLEKRIPLYQNPVFDFSDEIDILGHFLEYNLVFDKRILKGLSTFSLFKTSDEIDKYFEKGGKKPIRKKR